MPTNEISAIFAGHDSENSGDSDISASNDESLRENSRRLPGTLVMGLFVFAAICSDLIENGGGVLDFRMVPNRSELYRIGKVRATDLGPGEIRALQYRTVEEHGD